MHEITSTRAFKMHFNDSTVIYLDCIITHKLINIYSVDNNENSIFRDKN